MFKLTIEIADLTELSAVVQKLGGVATGGTIETQAEAPAKATRSRSSKPKETVVETPSVSSNPVDTGATIGASTQNESPVQSPASQASAPVSAPAIDRKAYNDAAVAILNGQLKGSGLSNEQLGEFMVSTFTKAGCPGGKITTISDEQMLKFFPIFKADVEALLASKSSTTSFV